MLLLEERLGEIRKNKCGTNMKIVKYYGHSDITVKFMDQYEAEVDTIYSNFIRGQVKNPYDKTVYDIGYIGEGKYKAAIEKQLLEPRYSVWRNLLGRCYSPKVKNYKAYSDCIVCDEWHNYQNFAEWYDSNIYQVGTERMHLDKDILVKNNRLYSPDTCLIVPQRINMLFLHKPNKYGLPNGIHPKSGGKYYATYKHKNLGTFNTLDEAVYAHERAKKNAIIDVANEYKEMIPTKVYDALLAWNPF